MPDIEHATQLRARVRERYAAAAPGGNVRVDIRGREIPMRVVRFPFVREGQVQEGVLA